IPDGDLMGFDSSSVEAEKPEVREARQPRPARGGERKPRAERSKTAEAGSEQKERDRNRRGKSKPRSASAGASATPPVSRPPRLPSDRDPETFLDDELDNFGNRVDYVSPYQNKQGRGRRPGAPAQPGAAQSPRSGAGAR